MFLLFFLPDQHPIFNHFFLFACIFFNYFIEEKAQLFIKDHTQRTALVVKHEQYKQVINRTNFTLSQIDNKLSIYVLTGNENKLKGRNQQIENIQGNISVIRDEAIHFVPKYLINLFLYKVRNRVYLKTQVLRVYHQEGRTLLCVY